MTAALVTVKLRGFKPHAMSVQYGAPDPPENLDHYAFIAHQQPHLRVDAFFCFKTPAY